MKQQLSINSIYKKEAKKINDEYIDAILKLSKEEESLTVYKDGLSKVMEDLQTTSIVKENSITIEDVEKLLLRLDRDYSAMRGRLKPHLDKVDAIKKRANILYSTLKEKYPEYSDEELAKGLIAE